MRHKPLGESGSDASNEDDKRPLSTSAKPKIEQLPLKLYMSNNDILISYSYYFG